MTAPKPIHHWNGNTYQTILSTAETGGTLSIVYGEAAPLDGPASHIHDNEDEIFIVLEGEIEFEVAGQRFKRGPLETAFVPRGHAHSFRTGADGARCITVLTPGGFEGFFAEMAKGQYRLPQDMSEVATIAGRYGSRFAGPGIAQRERAVA